jgi:geranylgeranyl diphosphate synthase type II
MAANLFKDEVNEAIPVALGIEIFHNFSLLHDDLMDRADRRRGKLTVHKKWDDNVAILSGDAMEIVAYQFVAKAPKEVLSEVLNLFSSTAIEVCEGQQYDMDFENRLDVTENEYIEMIRLKTAVLIACSLKMGAVLMNAPTFDTNLLYEPIRLRMIFWMFMVIQTSSERILEAIFFATKRPTY